MQILLYPFFFKINSSLLRHIAEILKSTDVSSNKLEISVNYLSEFDKSQPEIEVLMSSSVIKNPVIRMLHYILKNKDSIPQYKIKVKFVVDQCRKCKESFFMKKEPGCVGAGRYCLIDTTYK